MITMTQVYDIDMRLTMIILNALIYPVLTMKKRMEG